MVTKFTILTHKIAIQLRIVAESYTICSSRSRRPVRKFLDTPSYQRWLSHDLQLANGDTATSKQPVSLFLHTDLE